jgi:hypothetical protein
MPSRATRSDGERFCTRCGATGYGRYGDGVSGAVGRGRFSWSDSVSCYLRLRSYIRIRRSASPPNIPGRNRVRESRQHGSVRGVPGNWHPYRDRGSSRTRSSRDGISHIRALIGRRGRRPQDWSPAPRLTQFPGYGKTMRHYALACCGELQLAIFGWEIGHDASVSA